MEKNCFFKLPHMPLGKPSFSVSPISLYSFTEMESDFLVQQGHAVLNLVAVLLLKLRGHVSKFQLANTRAPDPSRKRSGTNTAVHDSPHSTVHMADMCRQMSYSSACITISNKSFSSSAKSSSSTSQPPLLPNPSNSELSFPALVACSQYSSP